MDLEDLFLAMSLLFLLFFSSFFLSSSATFLPEKGPQLSDLPRSEQQDLRGTRDLSLQRVRFNPQECENGIAGDLSYRFLYSGLISVLKARHYKFIKSVWSHINRNILTALSARLH